MTTSRQFFNTKPTLIEYFTLELYHPAWGYLRFVRDQMFEKTFEGKVYQPASMIITETLQDERNSISYEVQLGRIGSQAKQFAKAINDYPLGWMIPIESVTRYYLSDNMNEPYRTPVTLSVGSFNMDADNVMITLDTANPRGQSVARRYTGQDFPGTRAQIS